MRTSPAPPTREHSVRRRPRDQTQASAPRRTVLPGRLVSAGRPRAPLVAALVAVVVVALVMVVVVVVVVAVVVAVRDAVKVARVG